jgi:hypothetical protein
LPIRQYFARFRIEGKLVWRSLKTDKSFSPIRFIGRKCRGL